MTIKHLVVIAVFFIFLGCDSRSAGFETPEGPITPDGYRPPAPTNKNIIKMVRSAIKNMVFIKGGSYKMGNMICFDGDRREKAEKYQIHHIFCYTSESPIHKVTLDNFYLNRFEISFYEYDLFTQVANRSFIKDWYIDPKLWGQNRSYESAKRKFSHIRTGEIPAAIDWFQANDFCKWLGAITGLPIGLPTEAQWEYAARNRGGDTPYATDNGKLEPGRNYPKKEDNDRLPVNSYLPNPLGLHSMNFNVSEWVSDWFDEKYYQISPEINPQGPDWGTEKILRGGSSKIDPEENHNFGRSGRHIDYTHDKERMEMFDLPEGSASLSNGARCAIHLSEPIDIDNLKIDLSKPAPDSRAEWLATKDSRTADKSSQF